MSLKGRGWPAIFLQRGLAGAVWKTEGGPGGNRLLVAINRPPIYTTQNGFRSKSVVLRIPQELWVHRKQMKSVGMTGVRRAFFFFFESF